MAEVYSVEPVAEVTDSGIEVPEPDIGESIEPGSEEFYRKLAEQAALIASSYSLTRHHSESERDSAEDKAYRDMKWDLNFPYSNFTIDGRIFGEIFREVCLDRFNRKNVILSIEGFKEPEMDISYQDSIYRCCLQFQGPHICAFRKTEPRDSVLLDVGDMVQQDFEALLDNRKALSRLLLAHRGQDIDIDKHRGTRYYHGLELELGMKL